MITQFLKSSLVALSFIVLGSSAALAAPADFAGVWQTQAGWADEYAGWGGVNYTDCAIVADLKLNDEYLAINGVVVKCQGPSGQILKQSMPRQEFQIDKNGNITGPTGTGRIIGNTLALQLPDAYDGMHYVRFDIDGETMKFAWGYEGEEGSNFEINGGKSGLARTGKY